MSIPYLIYAHKDYGFFDKHESTWLRSYSSYKLSLKINRFFKLFLRNNDILFYTELLLYNF